MRKVTHIVTSGFRGDVDIPLENHTILTGPNGSGKTSVLAAIELVAQGYITGCGKENATAMLNASADIMDIRATINGRQVRRTWTRSGSTTSQTVEVDGVKAPRTGAEGMIALALGKDPIVFSPTALFSLSPKARTATVAALAGAKDVDALMATVEKCRTELNQLRLQERERTAVVVELSSGGDGVSLTRLETLESELRALETAVAEWQVRHDDHLRASTLAAEIAERTLEVANTIKQNHVNEADNEAKKSELANLLKERDAALGAIQAQIDAARVVHDHAAKQIGVAKDYLINLSQQKIAKTYKVTMSAALDALSSISLDDDDAREKTALLREEYSGLSNVYARRAEAIQTVLNGNTERANTHKKASAEMQRLVTRAQNLPPRMTDEEVSAHQSMKDRLSALRQEVEPMRAAAVTTRRLEQARLELASVSEKVEAAKSALATAQDAVLSATSVIEDTIRERTTGVLPAELGVVTYNMGMASFGIEHPVNGYIDRAALSGGERVLLDFAISRVLAPSAILFLDAAELDSGRLSHLLESLAPCPNQIVLCHHITPDGDVARQNGWNVVQTVDQLVEMEA